MEKTPALDIAQRATVVWLVMLASQTMVVFISQDVSRDAAARVDHPVPSAFGEVHQVWFAAAAAAFALAAFVIPRYLLRNRRKPAGTKETVHLQKELLTVWIVRWTLMECITLVGFVVSMFTADSTRIYPYFGASLFGFLVTFPSRRKL